MHCGRFINPLSRREMLLDCANGFGAVALMALSAQPARGDLAAPGTATLSMTPRLTHHPARATSVIMLYMDGGPSQVDTFDPKPRLDREHGERIKMKIPATQFNDVGTVMKCPWRFRQHGESGIPVSDLFPHVATCVDDLAVVRSMTSNFSEHTTANYFLHTGTGLQGRPSMGAWVTYGLGSESQNLPGFVVLNGGLVPPGGLDNFGSGFLPAAYQGSIFKPAKAPIADIERTEPTESLQLGKLNLLRKLDRGIADRLGQQDAIESAIANYELAFRMQSTVPELVDLSRESRELKRTYGFEADFEPTRIFAAQCLIARRLVERGVRFIELLCPKVDGDRWDQHGKLKQGHEHNARAVDQPIAALLKDLRSRGMLETTLVVWAGEFGRTPMAQGSDGRDHNPFGFSIWLAGGGTKGGTIFGATDDYGYFAVENKLQIHDLHATMLHLLGIDHKQSTFRFGGRDMRLTDVHGEVIHQIIA
jgi:hypothetical protein